ncbi:hypothetical protein [Gordoniibacillus kamchatkensis]|uniref:hypothetical protein n=1 Tax=Gordoniibacillus kamchatkensis TaxID=1590651 RepID=UPI000697657B|nr:hypothetical protein [Paenibacillus sp. VKM B-2647]
MSGNKLAIIHTTPVTVDMLKALAQELMPDTQVINFVAVGRGARIGVAATLRTTLEPTARLLAAKARELGRTVELAPALEGEAYRALMSGDAAGHDRLLSAALARLVAETDAVVLAQASMARVVASLPPALQAKCLTSPRLGMERVKQVLEGRRA